jgi:hypothetical protein
LFSFSGVGLTDGRKQEGQYHSHIHAMVKSEEGWKHGGWSGWVQEQQIGA